MFRRSHRIQPKMGINEVNHYEGTFTTTGAAETLTTVVLGIDAATNRGTHVPNGSVLRKVLVRLWATDATPVTGKHQCALVIRPGGMAFASGVMTGWFATTDPASQGMIEIRKHVLKPPHTIVTITGASAAPRFVCLWKGNKLIHDGDDVLLANLDTTSTQWIYEAYLHFTR